MNDLKTRKFWFLVLCISMSISFGSFTMLNQFVAPTKVYAENLSEKGAENDEKSNEVNHPFFIHEAPALSPLTAYTNAAKNLEEIRLRLPKIWLSTHTPPPDLG